SDTKSDSPSKIKPTTITGIFVGYELMSGYTWGGIYLAWTLDEFPSVDLSIRESGLARRQRKPTSLRLSTFLMET
ncbi:MAG: hypothetical protein ACKPKO_19445, partial [Candidatus Fonsibacter sp.]